MKWNLFKLCHWLLFVTRTFNSVVTLCCFPYSCEVWISVCFSYNCLEILRFFSWYYPLSREEPLSMLQCLVWTCHIRVVITFWCSFFSERFIVGILWTEILSHKVDCGLRFVSLFRSRQKENIFYWVISLFNSVCWVICNKYSDDFIKRIF